MAAPSHALILGNAAIRQLDGLYSLNDLHGAAGNLPRDRPQQFLRREETKALIAELEQCADSRTGLRVVNGGAAPGTYACRELVIAYAAWISAAFHLKVIRVFLAAQAQPAAQPVLTAPASPKHAELAARAAAEIFNEVLLHGNGEYFVRTNQMGQFPHAHAQRRQRMTASEYWAQVVTYLKSGRTSAAHVLEVAQVATQQAFEQASRSPQGEGKRIADSIHAARDSLGLADLHAIAVAASMEMWVRTGQPDTPPAPATPPAAPHATPGQRIAAAVRELREQHGTAKGAALAAGIHESTLRRLAGIAVKEGAQ